MSYITIGRCPSTRRHISRTHLWKDGIHLEDLGTSFLAGNFEDFLNTYILSESSEHSWLYTDKHFKGLYGNIDVLMSGNSLSPKTVSDISNLGSVSSNWNFRNVKDCDKNFSDRRLVLENPKLKKITDWSLEMSILIPHLTNLTT